jgi:hypothetical protein
MHESLIDQLTLGGLKGYVSGTLISNENLPPSYGVSGGPEISPRNSVKLSLTSSNLIAHCTICEKKKRIKKFHVRHRAERPGNSIYYYVIHGVMQTFWIISCTIERSQQGLATPKNLPLHSSKLL